ncbi:class I adenylate-forming enzyme family protein [Streptomyces sp. NPDC057654]|uniref:class I adenylate-forming enzyme family protein n=1 Tax=Streptomyces sp. NPDC057654 TaxID=3346196 RepID=UPI003692C3F2
MSTATGDSTTADGTTRDSTAVGAPLETLGELLGGPRIDDLLRRAAARAPERLALSGPSGELTYAALDERVSRCAAALRAAFGGPDTVVGIAAALDLPFAVAYFGLARAQNVSAIFNPLLREERLEHVLASSGAQAVIIPPAMHPIIEAVRPRLPALRAVVLTHRDDQGGPEGLPTLDELIRDAPAGEPAAEHDAGSVANLQFTSGTTGAPKTVMLTHRNLTVNAAQTAHVHRLTPDSVLLNNLPSFHLMHLNIAVAVGATHVLCPEDDSEHAARTAARFGATHYYSLPVRLARLAAHPRLPELAVPTLRAVLSGGSALPGRTGTVLSAHFGVPVGQGYGLAETSPSTHFDTLDQPVPGSCGPPVPGTECRIVEPETRAVLPPDTRGEIQVRGPQLMKGYLDPATGTPGAVDAEGWLSTGDIGYADADGRLFVVDRIKDVFKCDNWLVSPLEIESVLLRSPGIADCVVFDHPEETSGAVAHAWIVPREGAAGGAEVDAAVRATNGALPYYAHIRYLDVVERIPRSPTGKVQRRDLREQALAGRLPQ